ncbi:MAG: hypothetical protein IJA55_00210 [Clostridia bacterium]|nr:hypothetical protein [Clostridia bacterium]
MKYKAQGRPIKTDKGLLILSSADSIEFNADCNGRVSVRFYCEKTEHTGDVDVYFTGYVDGERLPTRYHVDAGENELVLAENIKGTHTFKLVRQTEWGVGDIYMNDILVEGEFLDPPADKELFIEFVGDSLVTGFGNQPDEISDITWGGAPIYQDATVAYPYLVGEALDADVSVVAIQGIGCCCGGWLFTMNDIYDYYPRVNEKDYSYKPQRPADIVVIHLLGNDRDNFEENGKTWEDVLDKAKELCLMARAKHPGAKIIFSPADRIDEAKEMVENKLGGANNGYYTVVLPMDCGGKMGHPSTVGHNKAKDILVDFIKELRG